MHELSPLNPVKQQPDGSGNIKDNQDS